MLRGEDNWRDHTPEDWLGSVTAVRGQAPIGKSRLADGELLEDAIAADPIAWLGAAHVQRWGADPMLLVKLLDAGERLPVHAHPSDDFAAARVGTRHGKTEAWYILNGGTVHLGLREAVTAGQLRELANSGRGGVLLSAMNEFDVQAGDTILVPAGVLHAIGAGTFLVEVQQPEDLSILVEWEGFAIDGARDGHLGLGFDSAVDAVSTDALTAEELRGLIGRGRRTGSLLPTAADPFFRIDREEGTASIERGFAVVFAESGELRIVGTDTDLRVASGRAAIVTGGAGDWRLTTTGSALIARPPRP
jgi:mannose-6-phosphate isomerase